MVLKLCYASKSVTNRQTDGRKDGRTDGRTDERPRSNMPLQLLRSWEHNQTDILLEITRPKKLKGTGYTW